jgi:anthranilate synthase component 2
VHYLEDLNCEVTVYRNDEFELDEIILTKFYFTGTWYSDEAGLLKAVIQKYGPYEKHLWCLSWTTSNR